MNLLKIFLVISGTLISQLSIADQLDLSLKRNQISDWEQSRYNQFIKDASKFAPQILKVTLPKISIRFRSMSGNSDLREMDLLCNSKDATGTLKLGKAVAKRFYSSHDEIILDELLWAEILKGSDNSVKYSCGHKNGYRLALATLLHELGHLYDYKKNISSDRRFLHLATFTDGGIFTSQKNTKPQRSVDVYEYINPKEGFAVNLEFFLLDPEYSCRRPALYEYYREALDHTPPFRKCQINSTLTMQGMTRLQVNLDIKRLYRVEYLLASEGTQLGSWFGHSMLRLVFCAPDTPLSEACINQTTHHVVVSFRASVLDNGQAKKERSIWDSVKYVLTGIGIGGNYPSKMFLLSHPLIVSEYNDFEFRDLIAVPLILSQDEKRDMLNRVLEMSWGYSGSYKFFTNNCKSETEDLLKSIIRSKNVENLNALTPVELREQLYKYKLADPSKEVTYKSMHRYLTSASKNLKDILTEHGLPPRAVGLSQHLIEANFENIAAIRGFFNNFNADERRLFILSVKETYQRNEPQVYKDILGNFLTLEVAALLYQKIAAFVNGANVADHLSNTPDSLKEYLTEAEYQLVEKLQTFKSSRQFAIENQSKLNKGYGVPQHTDWSQASSVFETLADPNDPVLQKKIAQIVDLIMYKQLTNLSTSGSNVDLILALLKLERS